MVIDIRQWRRKNRRINPERVLLWVLMIAFPAVAAFAAGRSARQREADTSPDLAAGYRTIATVAGIRYEPPKVSTDGYWELILSLDGDETQAKASG